MMNLTKQITLKHLLINNQRMIGMQFHSDKVIQALIKELPNPRWSKEFSMVYIIHTKENLNHVFEKFRGVAWINGLKRKLREIMNRLILIGIVTELRQHPIDMRQKHIC